MLMEQFRCQEKKGSFTVETTAWEGTALATASAELGPLEGHKTHSSDPVTQIAAKNKKAI